MREGRFTFGGRQYRLDPNTPEGHHLHGLVFDRPWNVDEAAGKAEGAVLRSNFTAADFPAVLRRYPFPFTLAVTYTLAGNTLGCTAEVRNLGGEPMPMGFGLHPFLRAPLAADGTRGDCLVEVPARFIWELDAERLPTGRQVLTPPPLDFSLARPLGSAPLDDVYSELARDADGLATCRLVDPRAGAAVALCFGPEFPHLAAFAPDGRNAVCLEPYTCVTDAINLAPWLTGTGLVTLAPGETWRGNVRLEVSEIAGI